MSDLSKIMTTTYNRPIRSGKNAEQVFRDVYRLNNDLGLAMESGKSAVDFIPWLRYVPFAPYKAFSKSYLDFAENTYKKLMDDTKANLVSLSIDGFVSFLRIGGSH